MGHRRRMSLSSVLIPMLALLVLPITNSDYAAAESDGTNSFDFTILAGDEIKNNPLAMRILENIEIAKQRLAEQLEKQRLLKEQQKFLDEQRQIADQLLQTQLDRMNKSFQDYSPEASFERFLSTVDSTVQDVFRGQFDFQREKAQAGHDAMMEVINSGGSWDEARQAYYENAATTRVQLIDVNKNLNIQYGLADAKTQQYFNEFGKIPRTEDSLPQDNFDSKIIEDESHLEVDLIQPTFQTDFVKKVSDDKCAKWNAKAQKFMAKGKGVPPGIAKKVLACNNGQDWKMS